MNDIERAANHIRNLRLSEDLPEELSDDVISTDSTSSDRPSISALSKIEHENVSRIIARKDGELDINLCGSKNLSVGLDGNAVNEADAFADEAFDSRSRFTTADYYRVERSAESEIDGKHQFADSEKNANEDERNNRRVSKTIDLPLKKLASLGFITPTIGKSLLTEEYRRIKRPLLKNIIKSGNKDSNNNVVMITSSVSGEGKTYTAINLAMSLAVERDRTVLLIDSDVIKGSASQLLGIANTQPGLTDLLSKRIDDPLDVILRTNIPSLAIMSAGTKSDFSNELLSSDIMNKFVKELSNRYSDRIILLDCPPILQTNEANVISEYAGQVVFVVAEEDTSQSYVSDAINQIDEGTYVGVVLNKSRNRLTSSGKGYGYTYA